MFVILLQVTEDVYRLIIDHYNFMCRGQVSVKGKGQMLTYFLEGRKQGSVVSQSQQQQSDSAECRSSAFTHASVCTKLSPTPTVTAHASIRTPSPGVARPAASTSSTRYLPSVPTAMVWHGPFPWCPRKTSKKEWKWVSCSRESCFLLFFYRLQNTGRRCS